MMKEYRVRVCVTYLYQFKAADVEQAKQRALEELDKDWVSTYVEPEMEVEEV